MMSLTAKQAEVLAFIKAYMAEHDGLAPSTDEMRVACGLKSKSNVHRILRCLEERRAIRRMFRRPRAIEILDKTPQPVPTDFASRLAALPEDSFSRVASMVDAERRRRQMRAAA